MKQAFFVRTGAAVWLLACALLLAGCGTKQIDVPNGGAPVAYQPTDDTAILESYRIALKDDGIPLTDKEMRAFLSEMELDKGLSAEELREVQIYFKYYLHSARPVMERFLRNSRPYMDYTRSVFRERGMPEELAMLAFVESGYNPMAVSRSNAVGMWQFMAPTGRQYGLEQSWWMDERRDPYRATHAAADYLSKLYGDFGDWHLAIAAYNAGEGKIGRALAATQAKSFFDLCRRNDSLDEKLCLKEETRQYVPRLLAMCKLMRNAESLGLVPAPHDEGKPVVVAAAPLTARPGTDLAALAQGLGMGWAEFEAYNPSFRRLVTPPDRAVTVYVPRHAEAQASALLRDTKLVGAGMTLYTVVSGDTLGRISTRTGVPVSVLRQMNPKSEPLKIGTQLRIPGKPSGEPRTMVAAAPQASQRSAQAAAPKPAAAPAASRQASAPKPAPASATASRPAQAAAPKPAPASAVAQTASAPKPAATASASTGAATGRHTVRPGETLASLARQYNVSLTAMREANANLENPNLLKAGQVIAIPGKGAPATVAASASTPAARPAQTAAAQPSAPKPAAEASKPAPKPQETAETTYKVQPGDTMWAIARRFNMPPQELLAMNNMTPSSTLRPGASIRVRN